MINILASEKQLTTKQALVQIEDIIHHRLVAITQSLTDEDIQSIKAGEMFGEITSTIKTIH